MQPLDYIKAARVPDTLKSQSFGLWEIWRQSLPDNPIWRAFSGFDSMTLLSRFTDATLHKDHGEVVMEDSARELRRHLPIWLKAKGRVLVTGLGLGCVVRGLLASPDVEHITVVEIDPKILRIVGKEFEPNSRVRMIEGDALKVKLRERFDYAWHDLWTEGDIHLQVLHTRLLKRFYPQVKFQGAWLLPRQVKRVAPEWILG